MPLSSTGKTLTFICLVIIFSVQSINIGSQEDLNIISADNAAQLEMLTTIENYKDAASYCQCDVRFFSQNGRTIATDQKLHDLVTGATIDLSNRGYPLALNSQGTLAIISGQDNGTRLLDIATDTEQMIMSGDAEEAVFGPDDSLVVTASRDADAVQVWQLTDLSLIATLGRATSVDYMKLRFILDGNYLIWNDNSDRLHFWDVVNQTEYWVIQTRAWNYALTPDETAILLNVDFDSVEAWNIETRSKIAEVVDTREYSGVDNYALSPDKQILAISYFGSNRRIELWNISFDEPQLIAEFDEGIGYALRFSPDSRYLIYSGGGDESFCDRESTSCAGGRSGSSEAIHIVDVNSGQIVTTQETPRNASIQNTILTSDGNLLITSSQFGSSVHLWQVEGKDLTLLATYSGWNFILSPDESTLLVELNRNFLAVYGLPSTSHPMQQYVLPAEIRPSSVNVRAEPDVNASVVGVASGTVRVVGRNADNSYVYLPDYEGWVRADSSYLDMIFDFPVEILNVLDSNSTLSLPTSLPSTLTPTPYVTATPVTQTVQRLDVLQLDVQSVNLPQQSALDVPSINSENIGTLSLLAVLPQSSLLSDSFLSVVPNVSMDGSQVITPPLSSEHYGRIWDLLTFEYQNGPDLGEHTYARAMIASPQGDYIAFTPDEFYVPLQLWSVDLRTSRSISSNANLIGTKISFSPDGTMLAYDGLVLEVPSCRIRFQIDNLGTYIFSSDSSSLAVLTRERVYFYEMQTGGILSQSSRVESHNWIESGIFSPDGSVFVATSAEGILAYDVVTGETLFNTSAENYFGKWEIENVAFSPDSQFLLALNPQGMLYIWEISHASLIAIYDTQGAKGMAFSPDGQLLALGNPLRFVHLQTGETTTIDSDYGGSIMTFSPDGTSLLVNSAESNYQGIQSVMVFGIPTDQRSSWQPVSAHIRASAINVRQEPDGNSPIVDNVSGEVIVLGRDVVGEAVYIAEPPGWVWSAPEYINFEENSLDILPVWNSRTSEDR